MSLVFGPDYANTVTYIVQRSHCIFLFTRNCCGDVHIRNLSQSRTRSQTVIAEKLKVLKKARRDASSLVFAKPPGEWKEAISWKMHCATAGDTEQNGAKHFTVARRAIVTCFRRVCARFAGICKVKKVL